MCTWGERCEKELPKDADMKPPRGVLTPKGALFSKSKPHPTTRRQERSSELNRLQKFLEDANIKLASVVSDIHDQSVQEMIQHLIQNDLNAQEMADLAKRRLRSKLRLSTLLNPNLDKSDSTNIQIF